MPYDNTQTTYVGSEYPYNDTALNGGVARFTGDPSALEYMAHYYTPTGDLHVPIITLHKTRDPLVPIFHEALYAGAVQGADASQYLLQRTVNGFGHCGFPNDELTAFSALVQWVHTGVKPQNKTRALRLLRAAAAGLLAAVRSPADRAQSPDRPADAQSLGLRLFWLSARGKLRLGSVSGPIR